MYRSLIIVGDPLCHPCMHLASIPCREEKGGLVYSMRMREIIDNNFIIQIVKKQTKLQKEKYI